MKLSFALIFVLLAVAQATSIENVERYCSVHSQDNCESLLNICQWNATEAVCNASVMRTLTEVGPDLAKTIVIGLTSAEFDAALVLASASTTADLTTAISAMTEAEVKTLAVNVYVKLWAGLTSADIEAGIKSLDSSLRENLLSVLGLSSGASAAQAAVAIKARAAEPSALSSDSTVFSSPQIYTQISDDPYSTKIELFPNLEMFHTSELAEKAVQGMDAAEFIYAKAVTSTTDSATLQAVFEAMSTREVEIALEKIFYLEFNTMTSTEQEAVITSLSVEHLSWLKSDLEIGQGNTTSQVNVALQAKASQVAAAYKSKVSSNGYFIGQNSTVSSNGQFIGSKSTAFSNGYFIGSTIVAIFSILI